MRDQISAGFVALVLVLSLAAAGCRLPAADDGVAAANRGDYATAMQIFRSLADRGDARAQYNLGAMYANGQGVPQDDAEAVKWYRKAADQGNARAQNNLGVMYAEGRGVPRNYTEAMKWYRKAADQGNARALSNLGVMYHVGRGVAQDNVQAYKWFTLAGAVSAASQVADEMTPAQIAEAKRLAHEWKPTK